ncbi:hypothetical protein BDW02DRAFT_256150 [Decorospora gaudefroyi]|uniref:Uncharacterized protein n=1 Tax=Decorospora gaudefroyi TaxID=184978 RepID=A0A6A5KDD0_9PLEO|nr:hypothetical protein BDW02DRAFT_256150 [Decorospora gaudefroyi]
MVPKPVEEEYIFIPSDMDEDVDIQDSDSEYGEDQPVDALSLPDNDSDDDDPKAAAKPASSTKPKPKPAKRPFKLLEKNIQDIRKKIKRARKKRVITKVAQEDTSVVKIVAPTRCSHHKTAGPDDHSRLLDTTLATDDGRIHMVFAVTQKLLNNRLKYLWASEPKMQVIDVDLSNGDAIHSFLLPPQLHLETESNRPGAAVFYINFDYGGIVVLKEGPSVTKDLRPEHQKVSTDGWVLAFDVDIALEEIDKNLEEYDQVKKKLGSAADFRISRLVADLETADIMNPRMDLSSLPGLDVGSKLMKRFQILLANWRDEATANGLGLMGWSATANPNTSDLPASFAPTDQQLQTYPYMAPGQTTPKAGLGPQGDYNMLLYLNMADGAAFPRDRFLDYGGNFCTPFSPVKAPKPPEIHATLCIGRDVFFNSFILPQLTLLNRAAWIKAKNPELEYKSGGMVVHWKKELGKGTTHDSYFSDWKPVSGKDWMGWEWTKGSRGYSRRQKFPLGEIKGEMITKTMNRVRVHPKGNIIIVDHISVVRLYTYHKRAVKREGRVQVSRSGTIHISIESVEDGQNMTMCFPTPDNLFTSTIDKFDTNFIGKRGTIEREAKSWLNNMKGSRDFNDGVANIQKALQKVGAFVVPTGGTLFLRDALFNDECDLMLKAFYNGIE